jgi:holin-like protein
MITGFIVLLVCQLIGDFTVHVLDVPIPGPVVGMVLLFVALQLRRPGRESGVVRAADGLLRHLQLLFIPAGVGIIQYLPVLAGAWLPVIAGLVISWLAVLLVTAGTGVGTLRLAGRFKRRGGRAAEGAT